ncbi:MAG: hypothetical protein ACTSW4_01845, partial [Candidatus Ranarchaeia archaeon]
MSLIYNALQYIHSLIVYQFRSTSLADQLTKEKVDVETSKRTGKPRYLFFAGNLFGTIRAKTGRLVLTSFGAKWVHAHLDHPSFRVEIMSET